MAKTETAELPATKCMCECGGFTGGGRFLPGHDSKLKSALKTAFRNGGLSAPQKKLVASLGWERFITPADAAGERPEHGMTVPQVNCLRVLAKSKVGLTRPEIQELIGGSLGIQDFGPADPERTDECAEKYGRPSLLSKKLIKQCRASERPDGANLKLPAYVITVAGTKFLAKIDG